MKEIKLADSLATGLASGHPWVYRDHLGACKESTGAWVKIRAGSFVAYGLYDADSPIAVRIFSTERVPDATWFEARVQEAYALRAQVRAEGVTGYRLIFGEADGLPGLVADVYAEIVVVSIYTEAWRSHLAAISKAILRTTSCKSVVLRKKDDSEAKLTVLAGAEPEQKTIISEGPMKMWADLIHGQKTGLFFDHRDNRVYVGAIAAERQVLNLFSYTGGFSLACALGGASSVTSVEIAAKANEAARENFVLNGLGDYPHEILTGDVFDKLEVLKKAGRTFDLIIVDPPSFAKTKEHRHAAEKAYIKLFAQVLPLVIPGGILCAASCTSQVGPELFRELLADAARKARVRLQVIRDIGHAPDHPILIGHPQGRYLKFVAGRVSPRV